MLALSNLASLLVAFAVAVKATAGNGATPEIGTVFAVYPGWDMENDSLEATFDGTERECLTSCQTNSACVAYTYIPYGDGATGTSPACILKSSIDLNEFSIQSFPANTALVGHCGTFFVSEASHQLDLLFAWARSSYAHFEILKGFLVGELDLYVVMMMNHTDLS
ncbi:hypothetical protein C8R45DRAFT_1109677 [Mycena sanguinolenta]|nr:hypothetical protein C8R45DRAFT_1109677 [Mycena sanguinolenta]